jgi:hypothetical protein
MNSASTAVQERYVVVYAFFGNSFENVPDTRVALIFLLAGVTSVAEALEAAKAITIIAAAATRRARPIGFLSLMLMIPFAGDP